ncbi:MAG: hypothetical protein PUB69_00895 [Desulfovibrionaceae bacterium]|nr:hypothetical protein [Desulfovibrionaceae bacterium]
MADSVMDAEHLKIAAILRPWRNAGITWLLPDEHFLEMLKRAEDNAKAVHLNKNSAGSPSPVVSPDLKAARTSDFADRKKNAPSGQPKPAPDPKCRETDRSAASKEASYAIPREAWPESWTFFLQSTPSHPRFLWSYYDYSRDICGKCNVEAHRSFLKRLIPAMSMPKGSHAFWPLQLCPPDGQAKQVSVNLPLFFSGIEYLNPETIFLMTGEMPPEIPIRTGTMFNPVLFHGRRYVVIPSIDDMIADEPRYRQCLAFLKNRFL